MPATSAPRGDEPVVGSVPVAVVAEAAAEVGATLGPEVDDVEPVVLDDGVDVVVEDPGAVVDVVEVVEVDVVVVVGGGATTRSRCA